MTRFDPYRSNAMGMGAMNFNRPIHFLQTATNTLADLVFPGRCYLCSEALSSVRDGLCEPCRSSVQKEITFSTCPTCAADQGPFVAHDLRCRECRDQPGLVDAIVRIGRYGSDVGRLIREFKYHGREELTALLVGYLADAVVRAPWRDQVEAVVEVPTHWSRRLTRPFYPAEVLARGVAQRLMLPWTSVLRRIRAGPRQVGLSPEKRAANVRGAFALRRRVQLRQARLLLIDDVRTTGATLEECAKVLRKKGAGSVFAAVTATVGWSIGSAPIPRGA